MNEHASALDVGSAIEVAPISTEDDEEREWDAFVEAHPDGAAYHLTCVRRIIGETFGHESIYLAARRGGRLVGVLPLVYMRSALFGKYFVSMPFFNYGGIPRRRR